MTTDDCPTMCRLPSNLILPFLMLAYPFTFLFYRGGRLCGSLCFTPTVRGVATLVAGLLVLWLVAAGIAAIFGLAQRSDERRFVRLLVSPSPLAGAVLLGLFGAFVVFLTLDALALYEAVWKPLVLPLSFLLFLPVWLLYVASFPLAILFSVAGIESSPAVTLLFRAIVVAIGFPLSAVLQTLAISAVGGELPSGSE